ncbi:F-box/FBD/LRR-repeat protein At1g13570-like [Ipomoea triloba]|uniref:F-box/FBD/LRR-repeat protein At1g13570-like n=1 Tax=Ipomoea triloba TaxID=35885 RepID=UPI00125D0722|nr:F-box/FBD/LRR-repeat protein At1g13570-like [Ipomoea triloba]
MGARKDIISELPDDVKDKILECLPIREAARTALLSTHWKHVWLRHGRLVFVIDFLECLRKREGDKPVELLNIVNHILLHRAAPVKKFTLCISCPELEAPKPQQHWCRYLSRNGIEELNITISEKQYKLSSCIIPCRTFKQLKPGHDRLTFDYEFVKSFQHSQYDEGRTLVNIINNIIFSRAGPVKKFTLQIDTAYNPSAWPQQYDFDRWCLFLSRNGVEELNLTLYSDLGPDYQLPFCLLSCKTIKQLIVQTLLIDLPVNAVGIFSNVTSLAFFNIKFKRSVNGIASSISIPKLEKLAFELCRRINKFEIISPPKLEIFYVFHSFGGVVESRWLAPHLKAIKTLWLCGSSLRYIDVSMFPTAINLQVMKLYKLSFGCRKQLTVAMQLLQKCPYLCELGMMVEEEGLSIELKMLNTIKIESFRESALIMLFMKMLLSKSPALERVVILKHWDMNDPEMSKILRKLECFPHASPNAQIVCMGNY